MTDARMLLALLLAASLLGCGGGNLVGSSNRDGSIDGPAVGASDGGTDGVAYAYNDCFFTTFLQVPGGGGVNYYGGGVSLGRSGSVLTANFGGVGGNRTVPSASLRFSPISGTSATLLPSQEVTNIEVPCGPLEFTDTVGQLASGSLTYNAGTVFLSVEGTATPIDAGNGCSNPGGPATIVVTCGDVPGRLPGAELDAGSSGGVSGSGFVGVYSCRDSDQLYRAPPAGLESGGGGTGTLTITEAGGVLTAAYANDVFVGGSLQFTASTESAAVPAASNETMQMVCPSVGLSPDGGDGNMNPVHVTASSLTIDGSWVVLSFVGDASPDGACAGAAASVSVLCAR